MPKTLNVGMIGYKFMGRAHSNAWVKADKFFDLKAKPILKVICGREKAGVMNACTRWGWSQFVTDWHEVVEDSTIDIVDINTPNDTHAEIAIAAAKAGKAILCEKPAQFFEEPRLCRQWLASGPQSRSASWRAAGHGRSRA